MCYFVSWLALFETVHYKVYTKSDPFNCKRPHFCVPFHKPEIAQAKWSYLLALFKLIIKTNLNRDITNIVNTKLNLALQTWMLKSNKSFLSIVCVQLICWPIHSTANQAPHTILCLEGHTFLVYTTFCFSWCLA